MRDPWETDAPDQQLQPEPAQEIATPESVKPNRLLQPEKTIADQGPAKHVSIMPPIVIANPTGLANPFRFGRANLIQGIIWAEILGKPKAKRGRR